jgi:uncharacterized cupredoxin-like copper-binding protein
VAATTTMGGMTDGSTAAAGACTVGDKTMATTTVNVILTEWVIQPSRMAVSSGSVHFAAKNTGKEKHELVVVNGVNLPKKADGSADESMFPNGTILGRVEVPPGKTCDLTVDMGPGQYVLMCNLVEQMGADMGNETHVHFAKGMHTTMTAA